MARESVSDRWGNEIYLTDERWAHIAETHDEMVDYRSRVLMTVRTGQRQQDPFDPTKYKYSKRFRDLPEVFTHIVVVVKFAWREESQGREMPNNFILTAYQVSRR
jgi:hypothetical protein